MNTAVAIDNLSEDRAVPEVSYDVTERSQLLRADHSSPGSDTPPEHRLMIALVRDAIRCIEKYRHARDFRGKRLFREDSEWILSDDHTWIYAFTRICETLDLEPGAVRRALGLVPVSGSATLVSGFSANNLTIQ